MGFLTDLLTDPIGVMQGKETVSGRQERQWQVANQLLSDATDSLTNENYEAAAAEALTGLLSLQLSRT